MNLFLYSLYLTLTALSSRSRFLLCWTFNLINMLSFIFLLFRFINISCENSIWPILDQSLSPFALQHPRQRLPGKRIGSLGPGFVKIKIFLSSFDFSICRLPYNFALCNWVKLGACSLNTDIKYKKWNEEKWQRRPINPKRFWNQALCTNTSVLRTLLSIFSLPNWVFCLGWGGFCWWYIKVSELIKQRFRVFNRWALVAFGKDKEAK